MGLSLSDEQRIEEQFDHFCKKVISNEMKDIRRHNKYLLRKEKILSELTQEDLGQLIVIDKYHGINSKIEAAGFLLEIENELLFEAISILSEKKRNIILLSYWLDMTDEDISHYLRMVRRTVSYMRTSSLKQLKKLMENNRSETSCTK